MKWLFCVGLAVLFGGLALGCGTKSVNGLDDKTVGPDGSGTAPDGKIPPTCDSKATSIAGTWSIIGSGASSTTSQLIIDANTFTFKSRKYTLSYHAEGDKLSLEWTDGVGVKKLAAAHTGAVAEGAGVIPLPIEANWTFGSDGSSKSCTSSLNEGALTAGCNTSIDTPVMRLFGSMVGERTEILPSVFGALSGKWRLVGEKGTLDVTFSKNTFTAKALNHDNTTDSVTFTVCDGTASGSTSTGHEFAASRE